MAGKKLTKEQSEKFKAYLAQAQSLQDLIDEVTSYAEEVKDDLQEYYDERSEKWQEGEKGEAFSSWIDTFDCEASDLDELIDFLENVSNEPEK